MAIVLTRASSVRRDPRLRRMRTDQMKPGVVLRQALYAEDGPAALAVRVHEESLREVARECGRIGARLVLFDIGYPRAFSAATRSLAGEIGAEYSPAGEVALARAWRGTRVYLANDGHWTAEGARIVAEELARTAAARDIVRD